MYSMETDQRIRKLNGSNFQTWKYRMEMILTRDDLWEIVADDLPTDITPEWTKRNRRSMATITLGVEDDQLLHIRNCQSAKEMWKCLKDTYERPNLNRKLFLLRKLYRQRLGSGQTMETHINAMMENIEQLRSLGEELKENHITAVLLCSLPDSYGSLITALEARPENEITLDYVKGKLVDEYLRRKENKEINENTDEALKAKYEGRPKRDTKTCYKCGQTGHIRRYCRNKPDQKQDQRKGGWTKRQDSRASIAKRPESPDADSDKDGELCFSVNTEPASKGWFIDSGATNHMTHNRNFFTDLKLYDHSEKVKIADGNSIEVLGIGSGTLHNNNINDTIGTIKLKEVLYIPKLEENLISVRKLVDAGFTVTFNESGCSIMNGKKGIIIQNRNKTLYCLDFQHTALSTQHEEHNECIHTWHRRFGHRDPFAIKRMSDESMTTDLKIKPCKRLIRCKCCIEGKMTTKPFPKEAEIKSNRAYQLLHSDLCGPMKTTTIGGKRYLLTITDDYSRYSESYLLKHKSETNEKLIEYIKKWNNVFQRKPQTIRTDGGGEYINNELKTYLKERGIQQQITTPYSPQQNGVSKRKNRSLLEMTRCLLIDSGLNDEYWGEAVITASYLQNRLPHRRLGRSPYELWWGRKPQVSHLRVFGSVAFVKIPNEKLTKLDNRTKEGRLMGYSTTAKGYRIRINDTGRVETSRNVTFIESIKEIKEDEIMNINNTPTIKEEETIPIDMLPTTSETQNDSTTQKDALRRSERSTKGVPPERLTMIAFNENEVEPETWTQITKMNPTERRKWIEAVEEEMEAFRINKAWDLVILPHGKRTIGCRWTFKLKQDSKGNIVQRRARLVAKGFSQVAGIDYQETYAPVVKYTTVRTILTIAAGKQMTTRHLDVKSAFLNGDIDEEIFMEQPEGQIKQGEEKLVCRLNKSIYGLKQSASNWNNKINKVFLEQGYTRGQSDPCLYTKKENGKWTYILLYVDDLLVCSDDPNQIEKITATLKEKFAMRDLGPVSYYLGIGIEKGEDGKYVLNQTAKIKALVRKYGLEEAKNTHTPMEINYLRSKDETDKLLTDSDKYRQAVGAILHIAMVSRPDICAAIGFLGRKVAKPYMSDWNGIKKLLKYLKTTINDGLVLGGDRMMINGYVDADWAGDCEDRKSTSGYVFNLDNSPISWASRKQTCIALSSTEAEYIAAATACQELAWIKLMMKDLGYEQTSPTIIHEDNQSCIKLIESDKINSRTKHIDVRYHMLKHLSEQDEIELTYCPSEEMTADILTKPLGRIKHQAMKQKLSMIECVD